MEEQLPLIERLPKLEVKAKPRSKYQQWKLENNYRKATDDKKVLYLLILNYWRTK